MRVGGDAAKSALASIHIHQQQVVRHQWLPAGRVLLNTRGRVTSIYYPQFNLGIISAAHRWVSSYSLYRESCFAKCLGIHSPCTSEIHQQDDDNWRASLAASRFKLRP